MKYWWLMMFVGAAACQAPQTKEALTSPSPSPKKAQPAAAAATYHYSPFVVQVPNSDMVFDVITFKDVGLKRDAKDPNDPLLETIAQSIAYEIENAPELGVPYSSVEYKEEYSDPANHQSCETQHLYVDVWNRPDQDNWGYSLWSGCGESDNFAWEEVTSHVPAGADITEQVQPLAGSIAAKLVQAHQQKCFVKKC